jgi:DNA-binding XRE family transcriptional regulator
MRHYAWQKGLKMHITVKIKGVLAMADVTYGELGALCGVSRQTIHSYLNGSTDIEDQNKGITVIDCVQVLNKLVADERLPLSLDIPKAERINRLKELVSEVTT